MNNFDTQFTYTDPYIYQIVKNMTSFKKDDEM